ncbi:ornithine carbamoyltransferase [Aliiglaciecola sp. LCG003]|uniref:ornithine carbamoyltransferase n=1 Tax=Aliiglaciecola sp. LCG003 TaxID=3053655 RepID=UPI00257255FD|nr:ornithine carbamoyltransferase [Aliiglaciecola sp. LCG003]WJG10022.1 ornithine carbamoyltransferase [Aliiglaciecola sp. LCG003]
MKQDLLTFKDWTKQQLDELLSLAATIKSAPDKYTEVLKGKSVVALFEKPSLRTRVSFEIGINKLGGHMVYLDCQAGKLAGREDAKDTAANLACWADAIVARVFSHQTLVEFSQASKVPVVNALCDLYHPCQAAADFLTLQETFGSLDNLTLAYLGDGNNVTHSLLLVGAILGVNITSITPEGYEVDPTIFELAKQLSEKSGAIITQSHKVEDAKGANVIYTDTWISMGDETPLADIQQIFNPYKVDEQLMALTGAEYVMHCQPAHRDLEISGSLIDGNQSLLMQQAENRMHGQNAILVTLLS